MGALTGWVPRVQDTTDASSQKEDSIPIKECSESIACALGAQSERIALEQAYSN